jgi:tetratricopeptide (TPR) repeat protein
MDSLSNLAPVALDELIEMGREANARVTSGSIEVESSTRFVLPSSMVDNLRVRFSRTESEDDLTEMISYLRIAAEFGTVHEPEWIPMKGFLATVLFNRFCQENGGNVDDLLEAIRLSESVLPEMKDGPPRNRFSEKVGDMYWFLFLKRQNLEDLKSAVSKTPIDNQERLTRLSKLCDGMHDAYKTIQNPDILVEAIEYGEAALDFARNHGVDVNNHNLNICPYQLADTLFSRFQTRAQTPMGKIDIDHAIELLTEAARKSVQGKRNRAAIWSKLGDVLGYRFDISQSNSDIDEAIKNLEMGIELREAGDPNLSGCLSRQHSLFLARYEKTQDPQDLQRALSRAKQALAAHGPDDSKSPVDLSNIGGVYLRLFDAHGDPEDLQSALESSRAAVAKLSRHDPDRGVVYNSLAGALATSYEVYGRINFLDEALEYIQKALDSPVSGKSIKSVFLYNKATMLFSRFVSGGEETSLMEAMSLSKEAIEYSEISEHYRRQFLILQCDMGTELFAINESPEDINEAIRHGRQALAGQLQNGPERSRCLNSLSGALFARFEHQQTQETDLDEAIELGEASIIVYEGSKDPRRSKYLTNLANKLRDRYFRYGKRPDIEAAVTNNRLAISIIKPEEFDYAGTAAGLAMVLLQMYELSGDWNTLEEAISIGETAAQVMKSKYPWHPNRPRILDTLGSMWLTKFQRTAVDMDIDKAVSYAREALQCTPRAVRLMLIYKFNLAAFLCQRFSSFGRLQDVDDAIVLGRSVVNSTLSEDKVRASHRLRELGSMYLLRYRRHLRPYDLTESIKHSEAAIALSSKERPDWPRSNFVLALSLGARFEQKGDEKDIERAIDHMYQALDTTPKRSLHRDVYVGTLGSLYKDRYRKFGNGDDLDEAIKLGFEAVDAAHLDASGRAVHWFNLARSLGERSSTTGQGDDRALSKHFGLLVLNTENAIPIIRVRAGIVVALQSINDKDWQKAYNVLEKAIGLLPRICPRSLDLKDQQHALNETLVEMATFAASCALQLNKDASEALDILESGRGIISGLVINGKNDITELELTHPKIAARYKLLRERISKPPIGADLATGVVPEGFRSTVADSNRLLYDPIAAWMERCREDIRELAQLENDIRMEKGFERFQMSPSSQDIMKMAAKQPIIVINVSSIRSDAILVTESRIWAIELPHLEYSDLLAFVRRLIRSPKISHGLPSTRPNRNEELRENLQWLWKVAVEKILSELEDDLKDFTTEMSPRLPRVRWVTNGLAGICPFHAAGTHTGRSKENTASRVISTYVTTLKALSYTKDKVIQPLTDQNHKVMIVSMPETAGQRNLSAKEEAEAITRLFEDLQLAAPTVLSCPSKAAVLKALQTSQVAHFACHGLSDPEDPSNGGLLLKDSLVPGTPDHLTIHDLSESHQKAAQIAYLSACSTAENAAEEQLLNEVFHVASAFQLLGFPHGIGTMWEVNDRVAVEVARVFYKKLLGYSKDRNSGVWPAGSDGHYAVALALHEAVRSLKEARQPGRRMDPATDVLSWAPFIHIGV